MIVDIMMYNEIFHFKRGLHEYAIMKIIVGCLWMIAGVVGTDIYVAQGNTNTGLTGLIIAISALIGAIGTTGSIFLLPMFKIYIEDRAISKKLQVASKSLKSAIERIHALEDFAKISTDHRASLEESIKDLSLQKLELEDRLRKDEVKIKELTIKLETERRHSTSIDIEMEKNQRDIMRLRDSGTGFPAVGTKEFDDLRRKEESGG